MYNILEPIDDAFNNEFDRLLKWYNAYDRVVDELNDLFDDELHDLFKQDYYIEFFENYNWYINRFYQYVIKS